MAYKIYTKGNYFYIVDTITGRERDGLAKGVRVTRGDTTQDTFVINGVNDWSNSINLDILDIQDENGNAYSVNSFIAFCENYTGGQSITRLANSDLGLDAWGIPKIVKDKSIIGGMFTTSVPVTTWYERINDVVQTTATNCVSTNGELVVSAGATLNDTTKLRTFRNPRYEPNRGHLFSTAGFLDNPNALMYRCWGLFTEENGAYFKLDSGVLKGVVRTTANSITTESEVLLDTTGVDLSKGNLYDLRFQWRGVGDYSFYVNQKLVGEFDNVGKLSNLSISNPALPITFESKNLGDNDTMRFGCVDVTVENGKDDGKTYGSISLDNESGQVSVAGFNTPVLVVKSKMAVDGLINTRDTLAMVLSAYADQRSFVRVWKTRDDTAITLNDQAYKDYGDGHLEYVYYDTPDVVTPMTFDTTKADLIYGCRVDADSTFETRGLYDKRTEIYQTAGDILIFTIHRENAIAVNCGITYQFAEQI